IVTRNGRARPVRRDFIQAAEVAPGARRIASGELLSAGRWLWATPGSCHPGTREARRISNPGPEIKLKGSLLGKSIPSPLLFWEAFRMRYPAIIRPMGNPTRRSFLRRSAVVAAMLPAAALLPSKARAEDEAEIARDFQDLQRHENDHVAYLLDALGDRAR